jgi:hypothetical protein
LRAKLDQLNMAQASLHPAILSTTHYREHPACFFWLFDGPFPFFADPENFIFVDALSIIVTYESFVATSTSISIKNRGVSVAFYDGAAAFSFV